MWRLGFTEDLVSDIYLKLKLRTLKCARHGVRPLRLKSGHPSLTEVQRDVRWAQGGWRERALFAKGELSSKRIGNPSVMSAFKNSKNWYNKP